MSTENLYNDTIYDNDAFLELIREKASARYTKNKPIEDYTQVRTSGNAVSDFLGQTLWGGRCT
mgnify:CR=1 FL=1